MRKAISSILIGSAAFFFAACSGTSPDANTVQVGNGDIGSLPIAELPSEFTSAPDALLAGNRLFDAGETERAIDAYLQAVKMDPDLADAYFKLGVAYSLVESEIEMVNDIDPNSTPEPTSKKAQEKKKNSEKAFESAVTAYKKIIAANAENDAAHFYLGLAYNKLNEDEDAARSLREAVKLKPENAEYQTELGAVYIKLAKYREAVAALKKAAELDPENLEAVDLLDKAEAGKKRIDFVPPKKDDDKPDAANSNSNANAADGGETPDKPSNSNAVVKRPAKPVRTPPVPARTPR
ncbi:MAG: tetratricopeptide repeat protein [Pyrinomonadaceae bacterium]